MNRQETLFRISQLLSRFTEQVKILNSNGEFSINIHAENILINILNTIYTCNLKNVNYEENKIYPSIDLRDYDKRIAIQVTSTSNLDKIKHTLLEFVSNELYKDFDTLYIYIITEKQKKYKQSSIDEIIGDKIRFTTEKEIDFVTSNMNETEYYQVSASVLDKKTLERELLPLQEISDNHTKILLTLDDVNSGTNHEGIKHLNVIDWLLE